MKKKVLLGIVLGFFVFLVVGITGGLYLYNSNLKEVDTNAKENITFVVTAGEAANTIVANLKKEGLIKDEFSMKLYVKLHPGTPQAGTYVLTKAMTAKEIYEAILAGKVTRDTTWVTFVEGKRLSYIASVIAKNFDYTEEEVEAVLDDKTYIATLIDKYDFLTDEILQNGIYHPLEGYLFPDTYEFMSDISIKGIIETMLDNTASKLSSYNENIESSKYSIHELMTLASIVELEGARSDDRRGVAGVFYNRLSTGNTLGSDVTTYYAVGKDFTVDLTWDDLNSCNGYNTRGTCVKGLPIGPIASPSFASLKATLEPEIHDYLFFVADKNGKTYFTKTNAEHEAITAKLKREGLWFVY